MFTWISRKLVGVKFHTDTRYPKYRSHSSMQCLPLLVFTCHHKNEPPWIEGFLLAQEEQREALRKESGGMSGMAELFMVVVSIYSFVVCIACYDFICCICCTMYNREHCVNDMSVYIVCYANSNVYHVHVWLI